MKTMTRDEFKVSDSIRRAWFILELKVETVGPMQSQIATIADALQSEAKSTRPRIKTRRTLTSIGR